MTEPAAQQPDTSAAAPTFDVLPLGPEVRRAIDAMGYRHPTPVQMAVFEPAAEGRSLVVQARTGTGKTAAFGMPIVDRLVKPTSKAVQALVLCPTRELALQVSREVEQIAKVRGTQIVAIYGGASMSRQVEALEGGAQIVVGTPGRVLDHLRQGTLDPTSIRVLVLDEADEMLSMGFAKELNAIIERLPKNRQGLFFSATIPADIQRLAKTHLRDTELIALSSDQVGALEITHYVYLWPGGDKAGHLVRILEVEDPESAIVFCNTRDETQRVAEALKVRGYDADWLNGDLPQSDRERVMNATKEGKLRFLVATDVAARGIDISHLTHVINFDFPESAEQYVHRTGRTGRAGRTGTAVSLVGPKDIGNVYLLRLTYKIRPIEKQLPSTGELRTRAEMDLLQVFVDAFATREAHPDDLSLARRLLTHENAERIVAGLLRDHLGARMGAGPHPADQARRDVQAAASEARRARNPEPQQAPVRPHAPARSHADAKPHAPPKPKAPPPRDRESAPLPRYTESEAPPPARAEVSPARPEARPARDEAAPLRDEASRVRDEAPPARDGASPARDERTEEAPLSADFVQMFVNVGKREGVRASDLQKLLTDKGIAPEETGRIRIRDRMSFVPVKKTAFDRAVAALAGHVIGGRTVIAELAKEEKDVRGRS